ncbi:protein enabled homolog [Tripterygium wilfordii]|uniref:protein enabled homolog n=1 Tax=Tripterygium wilfordii TaxID=458696 RepID=UPI0018F845C0|nr:protein enabled homolog [Tripterygium wilfordii]
MRSYLTLTTAFAAILGLLGSIATQARPLSKGSSSTTTTSSGSYEVPVIAIYGSDHDQYLSPKHPTAAVLLSDMDIVPTSRPIIIGNLERRSTPLVPSSPIPDTPRGQLDFGISPCHVVSPPPPPPPPKLLLLELPLLHETTSMVSKL